jgi:vacuolar-type H+-ATPase subunit E/Vma4
MALEHILAAIEDEATAQITQIERDSLREATAILDRARAQVQAIESEAAGARVAELEADAARLRNRTRVQVATHMMRTREAVFQRVLQEARRQLAAARNDDGYRAVLRALLQEALATVPGDANSATASPTIVRVDPQDEDVTRTLLQEAGLAGVELQPVLETWGGVEVASADERVVVRNTLESRLSRAEPHLRRLVAEAIPAMSAVYGEMRL